MWKSLKPATAIALALGLGACTSMEGPFSLMPGPADESSHPSLLPDKEDISNEMHLAQASMDAGDQAAAISIFRRLAREYPFSIKPRIALGEALLAANAPQEAERAYEGALKLKGNSYQALAGQGRVELALHQPAEALIYFERAVKAKPDDTAAQNGRAVSLDQLGRHDEAQAVYLDLLARDPSNSRVRNNYALSLALAGKYDDSTDILTGLAAAPDAGPRIRQNLSLVYGLAGNDGQAAHVGRMDLDEEAVANNLQYFQSLRHVESPIAKGSALLSPSSERLARPHHEMAKPLMSDAAPARTRVASADATPMPVEAPAPVRPANAAPAAEAVEAPAPKIAPAAKSAEAVAPVETREVAVLPAKHLNDQPTEQKRGFFNFFGSKKRQVAKADAQPAENAIPAEDLQPKVDPVMPEVAAAPAPAPAPETVASNPPAPSSPMPAQTSAVPAVPPETIGATYYEPEPAKPVKASLKAESAPAQVDPAAQPAPEKTVEAPAPVKTPVEVIPAAQTAPAPVPEAAFIRTQKTEIEPLAAPEPVHAPAVPPVASVGVGVSASIRPLPRPRVPAVPVVMKVNKPRTHLAEAAHQPAVPSLPQG